MEKMKKTTKGTEERWYDKNGNSWDAAYVVEKRAEELSKTLVDCRNCEDCRNCKNCEDCRNCGNCEDCRDCEDCRNCRNCRNCGNCGNCLNCGNCEDCEDCRNCRNCRNCEDCRGCEGCRDCMNFKTNPSRYAVKNIGGCHPNTCIYWTLKHHQVVCGCFTGNLEDFRKAVKEKYGSSHSYFIYADQAEQLMKDNKKLMEW